MSATTMFPTTTSAAIRRGAKDADALPDGVRVFRGILIGGALSCGLWAGIVAAVMAVM